MSFLPDLSVITSVYKGEKYLASLLENFSAQTVFPRSEIVLILNEASPQEIRITKSFASEHNAQVQVINVDKVETLGASWNRGWQSARAPYLAIWNVDDCRSPDSLDRQLSAVEQEPDWMLSYGDYVSVPAHGERGAIRTTPKYTAGHFRRSFAQGGAFWVLRRSVFDQIGPFDEQFQVAADMDLSFRMAEAGMHMGKVEGILGYFLDAEQGLSTRDGAGRSAIERTAVQLRYGVYDKIKPEFLAEAKQYRLDAIQVDKKWHLLSTYLPKIQNNLRFRQPLWILGRLRTRTRSFLKRIGLLDRLYSLQDKTWKREI
jgi:glycosyltransferase involved in cell wall biosynthesis